MYLLRFDPEGLLEMATGAEMVASRFFYALGYFVPENYVVYFGRDDLTLADGGESVTSSGGTRDIIEKDVDLFLNTVARDPERGYRAVATRLPASWEGLLGPYQVYGTRSDDPNDIVPHEHRRDQRGLFVFSAWLNHNEMSAVNTLDTIVLQNDVPVIRHHLVDFYSSLGSGGTDRKESWRGNEKTYDFDKAFKNIVGMGVYTPRWMRSRHPRYRATGRFGYEYFEPERWTPNALIAPFANRLPDDTYWAARQVMTFTDDDIRTIVSTGRYSDPRAEAWIAESLIERRNRIGATYFAKVLPLDDFEVVDGELQFEDLEVRYGFVGSREHAVRWGTFDNEAETRQRIGADSTSHELPPQAAAAAAGTYFAATITAGEPDKSVEVYVRKETSGFEVVGVERNWPGKEIADSRLDEDTGLSRFADLAEVQKGLFEGYTETYNENTEFDLTPEDYFNSMTISERTTYDAVTHALMNSELTDEAGNAIGRAIDLVSGVERIAGQYYGRAGDQQFRLYVDLHEGAREKLERAREFHLGHLNTVYHVGYPYSFRQGGELPSIQFSISEDAKKADIDVDYRSSKMPQAMFNGHLTSSNSDVRAGDNHEKHTGRWGGFAAWWRSVFGRVNHDDESKGGVGLLSGSPPEPPTPLPPDRPITEEPEELADAVQEFLTDWLVRQDIEQAMHFIADNALACVNTDEDFADEILTAGEAKDALAEAMRETSDELGDRDNLTEAIDVVLPWRESIRLIEHPFSDEFSLMELTNADASVYLCGNPPEGGATDEYGTYYGALFDFKLRGSAILGLLWSREGGRWRLVAWEAFHS